MRKFKIIKGQKSLGEELKANEIVTEERLYKWAPRHVEWNGTVSDWNRRFAVQIEEVKEMTLIEKIMEHFGLEEGEKFNVKGISYSPYMFKGGELLDKDGDGDSNVLLGLVYEVSEIEKVSQKSPEQIKMEELEEKQREIADEMARLREQMK